MSGSVSTSITRRGSHWNEELSKGTAIESTTFGTEHPESADTQDIIEPTLHELERQSRGWEHLRRSLLSAAVESVALPLDYDCVMCSKLTGVFRCLDCGPGVHYCEKCFQNQHKKTNVFHVAE